MRYALAMTWAGYSPTVATLWPLGIDLSIAQSTLALLALSGTPRRPNANAEPRTFARFAPPNGAVVEHNGAPLHHLPGPIAPRDWTAAADKLIVDGVTRIERGKVASVLAELADGTAPSTIARRVGVGYATVTRIAETTKQR